MLAILAHYEVDEEKLNTSKEDPTFVIASSFELDIKIQ